MATANPLIGLVVGLGTRLIAAEAISYVRSEQKFRVQQAIAQAAGNATGTRPVPWSTPPDAFFDTVLGAGHGRLQVVRDLGDRIRCREILDDINSSEEGLQAAAETAVADVADTPVDGSPAVDQADPWPNAGADPVKAAIVLRRARLAVGGLGAGGQSPHLSGGTIWPPLKTPSMARLWW